MKKIILLFGLMIPSLCLAQSYSINWYKVAGGGGTSTNGQYTVSGTIGQHDAGGPMTGGGYSLTGGFWSIFAVQTPGVPYLNISRTGPSSLLVWWLPGGGSYTLQTNGNVANGGGWAGYGGTISSGGGTNSVTVSPPTGKLFFRLSHP